MQLKFLNVKATENLEYNICAMWWRSLVNCPLLLGDKKLPIIHICIKLLQFVFKITSRIDFKISRKVDSFFFIFAYLTPL